MSSYSKIIVEQDSTMNWVAWLTLMPKIKGFGNTPFKAIEDMFHDFGCDPVFEMETISPVISGNESRRLEFWVKVSTPREVSNNKT
jgi:hypothetical protein